jgi:NAD(P)-dependent dehydrogenase (short-subunit alcohol dehydrogenase family)
MKEKGFVLITGGGGGMGEKIALKFLEDNFRVLAVSRNISTSYLSQSIAFSRSGISFFEADVSNENDVIRLMEHVAAITEGIDVLVNGTGLTVVKSFHETTMNEWNDVMGANLTALFICTKYALPLMKKSTGRKKHVFNILSIAAERSFPGWSVYCAAKAGALGFTEAIRSELLEHGIRLTAILPGATNTSLWDTVPGTWNRQVMLDPQVIADTIKDIYDMPDEAVLEKVILMPKSGVQ